MPGSGGTIQIAEQNCVYTWHFAYSVEVFNPKMKMQSLSSDNIRTITESVYVQKFQRLISGALSSGEFSKSLANRREAVGTYFASGFIDQWVYYRDPTFQVAAYYRFV